MLIFGYKLETVYYLVRFAGKPSTIFLMITDNMSRIKDYVSPELETVTISVSFSILAESDNTEQNEEGGQINPWNPNNP